MDRMTAGSPLLDTPLFVQNAPGLGEIVNFIAIGVGASPFLDDPTVAGPAVALIKTPIPVSIRLPAAIRVRLAA